MNINNKIGGYRPDIDGLRAIACLAVVIFHAFPNNLKGGFVGVDIFFVISGFLISSILYRNLFNADAPGRVNIVDFYIRRVRRIFPALIATLITTLILGWFVLLPEEYKLLGKHTLGGATYINNFMLYKESGDYFNAASNAKPLLHLWSLGVEEQFYLIFPILLWLVYKTNLNFIFCLTIFTVVSFTLNKNGIKHNNQTASFYLPWCRFWELSSGAVLSYYINYHKEQIVQIKPVITHYISIIIFRNNRRRLSQHVLNNIFSILGLITIIYGILTINNDVKFPGTKALIPVFGALMIIGAGKTAVINKYILSNRVMVFLGLISYPLYLWHWPLLSLAYICEGQVPAVWIRLVAVVIALILSIITYFVIEPPLRYGNYSKTKALGLFVSLLILGGCGIKIVASEGYPNRYPNINSVEESEIKTKSTGPYKFHSIYDQYVANCKKKFPHWNDNDLPTTCAFQSKEGSNNIALIGSSHAAHLFYGLAKKAQADKNSIALFPMGSQSPFLYMQTDKNTSNWYKRIADAYKYVKTHSNIKVVILANLSLGKFADLQNPTEKDRQKILASGVRRSLDILRDKEVVIVLDNPVLPFDPNKCINERKFTITKNFTCTYNRQKTLSNREMDDNTIKNIAKEYSNVTVVDLDPLFCKENICFGKVGDDVLYKDFNHFNYKGSKYVAEYLYETIKNKVNGLK